MVLPEVWLRGPVDRIPALLPHSLWGLIVGVLVLGAAKELPALAGVLAVGFVLMLVARRTPGVQADAP